MNTGLPTTRSWDHLKDFNPIPWERASGAVRSGWVDWMARSTVPDTLYSNLSHLNTFRYGYGRSVLAMALNGPAIDQISALVYSATPETMAAAIARIPHEQRTADWILSLRLGQSVTPLQTQSDRNLTQLIAALPHRERAILGLHALLVGWLPLVRKVWPDWSSNRLLCASVVVRAHEPVVQTPSKRRGQRRQPHTALKGILAWPATLRDGMVPYLPPDAVRILSSTTLSASAQVMTQRQRRGLQRLSHQRL